MINTRPKYYAPSADLKLFFDDQEPMFVSLREAPRMLGIAKTTLKNVLYGNVPIPQKALVYKFEYKGKTYQKVRKDMYGVGYIAMFKGYPFEITEIIKDDEGYFHYTFNNKFTIRAYKKYSSANAVWVALNRKIKEDESLLPNY